MSGCVMFPIVSTLNATNVLYTWSYEKKVNELGNKVKYIYIYIYKYHFNYNHIIRYHICFCL